MLAYQKFGHLLVWKTHKKTLKISGNFSCTQHYPAMFIKKLIANNVQTKVKRLHQSEIATSFQDRFKCYLPPTESGKSPVSSHAPRPPPDDFAERRAATVWSSSILSVCLKPYCWQRLLPAVGARGLRMNLPYRETLYIRLRKARALIQAVCNRHEAHRRAHIDWLLIESTPPSRVECSPKRAYFTVPFKCLTFDLFNLIKRRVWLFEKHG